MGAASSIKAAAFIAISSCVAGFSAPAAWAQTEIRVMAASSGSGIGLAQMAEQFNASQAEIRVVVEQVPPGDSYAQTVFTQLQAGTGPDLFLTNAGYGAPESMLPIAESGGLADLAARPWAKDVPENAFRGFWRDGKLYGLPLTLMNVGYVYNVDLMKREGLSAPTTFDELLALCDAAAANGKNAVGVAGVVSFYFYESMAIDTVFVDDAEWSSKRAAGEVTFAKSPGWAAALEHVAQMREHKCFQPGVQAASPAQLFGDIAAENVLGAIGPTTLMGAVVNMNPDINLAMIPVPGATADRTVAAGIFNEALSLNAKSTKQGAAAAFLDWLSDSAHLRAYANIAGGTAPADALAGKFATPLAAMTTYYTDRRVRSIPHHDWRASEMRGVLNQSGSAFFAGSKTVEQFLADLDAAWK